MKAVHLWAPSFESSEGGIQAYSAELQGALGSLTGVRSFSLQGRRTAAFAIKVMLGASIDRPSQIITTHLNFSPLALALKRFAGLRYAVSLHGIEAWRNPGPARLEALRRADILLPVSRLTLGRAQAIIGPSPARWEVLHNTYDAERFSPGGRPDALAKRLGIGPEKKVILCTGRMDAREAYKGQDRIIHALPEVLCAFPDSVCIFVGEGTDRPRLEGIVGAAGLGGFVHFAGRVPAEDLADYYRLCDVFAMASKGEGFGITYLEAMACGRPVIAGNIDAGSEVLRDGELGIPVNPDDPPELASAIIACLGKSHPNPLIFSPEALSAKAAHYYGREAFRRRLTEIFGTLP